MSESYRPRPSLPAIITAARAGALTHAWAMFDAGGYDRREDDPAALAVKGRLLKDRAQRAPHAGQATAYAAAATAYAAADRIAPQPYTRINMATLHLLSGDRPGAIAIAQDLLSWLDRDDGLQETPYYLAASRAEALLLCGNNDAAEAAFRDAIANDRDGWADHASTLRQLRLILDATGQNATWLNAYRPPRSLYFAGHLGVASNGSDALRASVDAALAQERVGFGFGALAAGSDIVVAEALLARGAELHIVLPTRVEAFIDQSVTPFDPAWRTRFDACLDAATSVQTTAHVIGDYEPLATQLAADVAMGAAVLNARQLESEAVQLVIVDDGDGPYGSGIGTARDATRWAAAGRRQHRLVWPRNADVTASGAKQEREGRPDRRLAAMLHIAFDGLDSLDEAQFAAAVDDVLGPFRTLAAGIAVQPDLTLSSGNARIVVFAEPDAAWVYARTILTMPVQGLALKIAGHYALAHWLDAPPALVGRGITELNAIAASAIPGVLTVSETLASALFAGTSTDLYAECVGESGDMRLFAVTAR